VGEVTIAVDGSIPYAKPAIKPAIKGGGLGQPRGSTAEIELVVGACIVVSGSTGQVISGDDG
jgi:hypothetical protein